MQISNPLQKQIQCLRVEVETLPTEVEILGSLLWDLGTLGFEEDSSEQQSCLTAYFPDEPPEAFKENLNNAIELHQLTLIHLRVEQFQFNQRDWLSTYREYFKPFAIGSAFYVYPEWEKPSPKHPINLQIDPSHAFGTGTHESTRLCLLFLEDLAEQAAGILDFGTGSGILSVAARKLNPEARIVAFDIDPMAVECAVKSFTTNQASNIDYFVGSASALDSQFDVVVANLTANIHRSVSKDLIRLSKRHLILSGITVEQAEFTLDGFRNSTLRVVETSEENGWMALHLE